MHHPLTRVFARAHMCVYVVVVAVGWSPHQTHQQPAASAGKKSLLSKATVDSSDDDSDDMEPQANEPTAEAAAKVSKVLDDTSSEEDAE